ncbi:hypothetical protein GCM10009801_32110 [Streptomyces albiaxialis]|uniref:Uncharacterized protein n=1 Tax=Streptomyces albiaxialis TaxID=329523 RepID=A0ABP5HJQ0_9ACTN
MTTPPPPPSQPPGPPSGPPSGPPQGPYDGGGFGPPPGPPSGPPQGPYDGGGFGPPGTPGPPGPPFGQPAPPPGGGGGNGKVVAIVVACVVVAALIVGGVALFAGGGDDDGGKDKAGGDKSGTPSASSSDGPTDEPTEEPTTGEPTEEPTPGESAAEYELAFPAKLENGKFRRSADLSDKVAGGGPGQKAHMGRYTSTSSSTERLLYAGAAGEDFGNPELSKDQMMKGMEGSPAMKVAVKRRDITPDGAEDPLTCEVLVKSQAGRKLTIPVCAWSNPGTAAYVADDSLKTYSVKPADVDLEDFAGRVNTIRDEVRKPAD